MYTDQLVKGRVSGVLVNGAPQCDIVIGDKNVYETKPFYKYDCEWEKLRSIVEKIRINGDATSEILSYMNTQPQIKVNIDHEDDRDPAGIGYSMVMKSIIKSPDITACIGCTPGDIHRMHNMGKRHLKMYHYIDEKWPMRRRAEERKSMNMIKEMMQEYRFVHPLVEVKTIDALKALDEFFFCGYLGYLLHDKVVKGIAPELNYFAAVSYGVTILKTTEKEDRIIVQYLRNGGSWTYEFRRESHVFAVHGSTFVAGGSITDFKSDANIYNVISSSPTMIYSEYYHIDAVEALHVAERSVVPVIKSTKVILDNGTNFTVGCDCNNNPVWIMKPALESRSNKYHLRRLTGAQYKPYEGTEFTTISSAMNVYHTFKTDENSAVEYKEEVCPFPSKLYYHNGSWVLSVFPDAVINEKGQYLDKLNGKRIHYGRIVTTGSVKKGEVLKYSKGNVVILYSDGNSHIERGRQVKKKLMSLKVKEDSMYEEIAWDAPYGYNLQIPFRDGEYWKPGETTIRYSKGSGKRYVLGSCPQIEAEDSRFIKLKNVQTLGAEYGKILYEDLAVSVFGEGNTRLYEFSNAADATKFKLAHMECWIPHAYKVVHLPAPFDGKNVLWDTTLGLRTSFYRNPLSVTEYVKYYNTYDARLVMSFDRNQRYDGGSVGGFDYISLGEPCYIDNNDD